MVWCRTSDKPISASIISLGLDIFKCIFLTKNVIMIKISQKCVPNDPINIEPALLQIMVWLRTGHSLPGLLIRKCDTRPPWVNVHHHHRHHHRLYHICEWCLIITLPTIANFWVCQNGLHRSLYGLGRCWLRFSSVSENNIYEYIVYLEQ